MITRFGSIISPIKGDVHTAVLKVRAEVCLRCGERLYTAETVRRFEEMREKLERQEEEYPMRRDDILHVLARFRDLKQDEFGIIRIGVFGSVAREENTDASDVDVVVELGRPDLLVLVGIKQELEELLQQPVDVVRYRERMNAYLKQRIEQEAVYV
jgi:predicted nucleotidyltransferase